MNLTSPIPFLPNRVPCSYDGSGLLAEFLDAATGDTNERSGEEWLASTEPVECGSRCGLSWTADTWGQAGPCFAELIETYAESLLGPEHVEWAGASLGFTCRLMDIAPDSSYTIEPIDGAPSVLTVLATRTIEEHHPSLDQGEQHFDLQPGQSYYLTGRDTPTIQGGALVLRVSGQPGESTEPPPAKPQLAPIPEHVVHHSDEGLLSEIVPAHAQAGFTLCKLDVASRRVLKLPSAFALVLCVEGRGRMFWAADSCDISRGRYYYSVKCITSGWSLCR